MLAKVIFITLHWKMCNGYKAMSHELRGIAVCKGNQLPVARNESLHTRVSQKPWRVQIALRKFPQNSPLLFPVNCLHAPQLFSLLASFLNPFPFPHLHLLLCPSWCTNDLRCCNVLDARKHIFFIFVLCVPSDRRPWTWLDTLLTDQPINSRIHVKFC